MKPIDAYRMNTLNICRAIANGETTAMIEKCDNTFVTNIMAWKAANEFRGVKVTVVGSDADNVWFEIR